MKQIHIYKIDLTEIEGRGDFSCPKCGAKISPDDQTETIYSILGSLVKNNCLEEVGICCQKCYSHIHITGFSLLHKI